jgi:outer membrane protein assembly factor BamB
MTVIQLHPRQATEAAPSLAKTPLRDALLTLLLGGPPSAAELPELRELLSALVAMAEGTRRKSLLPLIAQPAEWAILRRGSNVLVSYYHTDSSPEVVLLDRRVPLRAVIDAACAALREHSQRGDDPWARELEARLVKQAAALAISPDEDNGISATRRLGGALEDPGEKQALSFGFEAAIFPSAESPRDAMAHADVHAMLFGGTLWAWVRGRRIPLSRGLILLSVQRMVSAVRALIEAAESERPANVRLRSGGFVIGVRRDKSGEIALTLGSDDEGIVTIPALDLAGASLPILRVASDLVRTLVSIDRSQTRNLRITALRDEVRRLRRIVRARARTESFVNGDPERLRAVTSPMETRRGSCPAPSPNHLRFVSRWSAAIDGLDAATTFLCGERLVLATPRRVIALHREDGQVLWQREGAGTFAFLAGTALVRLNADGGLELRNVESGEALLRTKLAPRLGGPPFGLWVSNSSIPPTAVVAEGRDRLAAIDVRTGELRWRFSGRGAGEFRVRQSGRLLLIASGDSSVQAIDAVTGELAWRHSSKSRFCTQPLVCGETALFVSGEPGRGEGELLGLDLYSGRQRFRRPLGGASTGAPVAAGELAAVPVAGGRRGTLAAFRPDDGALRWACPDPGLGVGGAALALDRSLVINTPKGSVHALDLGTGDPIWTRNLSHPVSDDVPRRLEPVLRGGALFVPSAAVHVLRTSDGNSIGGALPCDLVPDAMHVDERGWVYVAEESGHLAALAPAPHLTLLRN